MAKVQGIDGRVRPMAVEREINMTFASCFGSPAGRQVLEYLKSITTNVASGPEVNVNALIHLEGQRFLVGLIQKRLEHGHKENRNAARQDTSD